MTAAVYRRLLFLVMIVAEIPLLIVGAIFAVAAPIRVALWWQQFWSKRLPDVCWYFGGPFHEKKEGKA